MLPTIKHSSTQQPVDVCSSGGCIAIVDSGTTFIEVDGRFWDQTMNVVLKGKACVIDTRVMQYKCKVPYSARTSFPTLSFTFAPGAKLELRPEEYVDCYHSWAPYTCRPRLRKHIHTDVPFWIFGDFFMRKYYTAFDRDSKTLSFACAKGIKNCKPAPTSTRRRLR